jgi:heme A synthase
MRAVFHPVIDWVDVHHRLVSLVLMLLILGLTLFILRNYAIFRRIKLEDAVQVHIGRVLPQAAQDQGVPEKVEVDGE